MPCRHLALCLAALELALTLAGEDRSLYSFGRSETWERPGGKTAGYAWMGGWALRRYDP